ncbi:MAG: hypothetical protein GY810_16335 [Aureispira sp.]|nr:hypothetical protein [Aureispira sp.]
MEQHPENIIGSDVVVVKGSYKGMYGSIVGIEGNQVAVEIAIFGRATKVLVKERELTFSSPAAYILGQLEQAIEEDAQSGLEYKLDEWWQQQVLSKQGATGKDWDAYLIFKKEVDTQLKAVRVCLKL